MTLNFKEYHLALENKLDSELQLWDICPPFTRRLIWQKCSISQLTKDTSIVAIVEEPEIYILILLTFHLKVLMLTSCLE